MRICHLTSVHPWQDMRIFWRQCRSLAAAGHEVFLVAPDAPAGEMEGVHLRPVPKARRRLHRFLSTGRAVVREGLATGADVFHLHDPELIPLGLYLKVRGKRVIYDAHEEIGAQVRTKYWVPPRARPTAAYAANGALAVAARTFDGIVAATPRIAETLGPSAVLVQNFPLLLPPESAAPYTERDPSLLYIGGLSRIRGITELVTAVDLLAARRPVRLDLAGDFRPASYEAEVRSLSGWRHTRFHGWVSPDDGRALAGQARIGVVPLLPAANHLQAYPNKMFEFMAAGLPIVASDFPLWRRLVADAGAGLMANPGDPADLAAKVTWLLDNENEAQAMGAAGRAAVESMYHWENEFVKLLAVYERIERA